MGTLSLVGLTSSSLNIGFLSAEITAAGGFALGFLILFILIVIAGFLVIKYKTRTPEVDDYDDADFETKKGIAKKKLDN